MSKIIVAGAGIGGIVSAGKLAAVGHDVTLYETKDISQCGHDQKDAFDATAMDFAGIEIPDGYITPPNQITYYSKDKNIDGLRVPALENYININVERKTLFNYLYSLALKDGVKFSFNTKVISPIIENDKVIGIKTDKGDKFADMIIDSCGIDSPLRTNLPESMLIEKEAGKYNYIYSYRVIYDRKANLSDPVDTYSIYFISDTGFVWEITEDDYVDILIVDFNDISSFMISDSMMQIRERNPHIGRGKIRNGRFCKIPVRQPAAVFVANSYAAIGDAAFMTAPIKGSGISNSLKAATILANVICEETEDNFGVEHLWKYEIEYFNQVGFNSCKQALMKNLVPHMTADEISEIFKKGLITNEEITYIYSNNVSLPRLIRKAKDKIKVINDLPEFKNQLLMLVAAYGRFALLDNTLPQTYSKDELIKWKNRYNNFFDNLLIPNQEENEIEDDE